MSSVVWLVFFNSQFTIHISHNVQILFNKNAAINESDDNEEYHARNEYNIQQNRGNNEQRTASTPFGITHIVVWLFHLINVWTLYLRTSEIKKKKKFYSMSLLKPNLLLFTHFNRCVILSIYFGTSFSKILMMTNPPTLQQKKRDTKYWLVKMSSSW